MTDNSYLKVTNLLGLKFRKFNIPKFVTLILNVMLSVDLSIVSATSVHISICLYVN